MSLLKQYISKLMVDYDYKETTNFSESSDIEQFVDFLIGRLTIDELNQIQLNIKH